MELYFMISREGYIVLISHTQLKFQICLLKVHYHPAIGCVVIYIWSDSKQKIPYSNLVLVTRFVLGQESLFAYPVS